MEHELDIQTVDDGELYLHADESDPSTFILDVTGGWVADTPPSDATVRLTRNDLLRIITTASTLLYLTETGG